MTIKRLPPGFIIPAQPVLASRPPSGADWAHEIKHDGYRLIVRRDGPAVRLYTRNAHDLTTRLQAIAAAAERINANSFTIDGEGGGARSRRERKAALALLLRDTKAGILLNERVAGDGPTVFEHACRLGAEGIVSKKVDGTYRSGPCPVWIKVRNPASIAVQREWSEKWDR